MSRVLGTNRRIWSEGRYRNGASPQEAANSLLVVRYPNSIDTPPTIDDETPLSGIYWNYLGMMLEAIQTEVGPMVLGLGTLNLLQWLGSEVSGSSISNWQDSAKSAGGNSKGQVYGLQIAHVSGTASLFANSQIWSATNPHGATPTGKEPIMFCSVSAFQDPANVFTGPAAVRAFGSFNASSTSISGQYRGNNGLSGGGSPSGSGTYSAMLLAFYMTEAF